MSTPRQTAYLEMLRVAREVQGKSPLPPGSIVELPAFQRQPITLCFRSLVIGVFLGAGLNILALIAGLYWA